MSGSAGNAKAADFLSNYLAKIGLKAARKATNYSQSFEFTAGVKNDHTPKPAAAKCARQNSANICGRTGFQPAFLSRITVKRKGLSYSRATDLVVPENPAQVITPTRVSMSPTKLFWCFAMFRKTLSPSDGRNSIGMLVCATRPSWPGNVVPRLSFSLRTQIA